ncbi:MAG: Pyridoxal-dependent decarboxylase protein [uncultured bacterium (gcode 4)]|uniref:Pyridoxal-dependent decarboxylase protein n=1 Tax=uncultured bacterium (gcode 4) TaxID=1234023 RepID=K2GXF7_9BACT|nr:MAG: Pyridoxal-dependent decarboxylase protein [uncultured bacterium (gcode 4)]
MPKGDKNIEAKYEKILKWMLDKYFLSSDGSNSESLIWMIDFALNWILSKHWDWPMFNNWSLRQDKTQIASYSKIPDSLELEPNKILSTIPDHMWWSVKAFHPYMVKNVIPLPNFIYLATNLAVSLYMPNAVTWEDSGDILNSELFCANFLSDISWYDKNKSAWVFTFWWTGTNLYAIKIGLSKAFPNHHLTWVREDWVVIGSRPSHYCHRTSVDWLGLWQNNYVQVESNINQTTNLEELKLKCREVLESWKKIICIELAGWTTSNMWIDDIESIYHFRNKLVDEFRLDYSPHIHVDAVLGWVYLFFLEYDFDLNNLGFSVNVMDKLKKICDKLRMIKYADSYWVDFHKTWYIPYVSSMIMVKDGHDFKRLRRDWDLMTPLFHDDLAYNPWTFTLETSRSASNILATWLTLKTFWFEWFQALIWHTLEISEEIRDEIWLNSSNWICVVNKDSFWCDVFVRCYNAWTDTDNVFDAELIDSSLLVTNNEYLNKFAKYLIENKSYISDGIAISKSSAAIYTETWHPMPAIRIYPLNPNITKKSARDIIKKLITFKKEFDLVYSWNK